MNLRRIDISTDTFAALWSARQPDEFSEEDIIRRLLGMKLKVTDIETSTARDSQLVQSDRGEEAMDRPPSIKGASCCFGRSNVLAGKLHLEIFIEFLERDDAR